MYVVKLDIIDRLNYLHYIIEIEILRCVSVDFAAKSRYLRGEVLALADPHATRKRDSIALQRLTFSDFLSKEKSELLAV